MKFFTTTLILSALFIISIKADTCSEALSNADIALSNLKRSFLSNNTDSIGKNLNSVRTASDAVQASCEHYTILVQEPPKDYSNACSFIKISLTGTLEYYTEVDASNVEDHEDIIFALEEVLSLLLEIEEEDCINVWKGFPARKKSERIAEGNDYTEVEDNINTKYNEDDVTTGFLASQSIDKFDCTAQDSHSEFESDEKDNQRHNELFENEIKSSGFGTDMIVIF